MALRGFGIQSLTAATAIPVFGTQLTAAITAITADRFTGRTDPRSQASLASAVVTSTVFFRLGDYVNVGPAAGPWESAEVTAITAGAPPAGTLTLKGLTKTHLVTDYVILAKPCAGFRIEPISVTASMFLGEDSTVASASVTTIHQFPILATAGTPYSLGMDGPSANVTDTSHLWIIGTTTGDKFLPSILMI